MKQTITINGKEYSAVLNIRAAKTYEQLTGKDISTFQGVSNFGDFVFACIDAAAKKDKVKTPLTYDDVLDSLDFSQLDVIVEALMPKAQGE